MKLPSGLTDDPNDPRIRRGVADAQPVPQNEVYLVLPEAERAKGYVRPFRDAYKHVGKAPPRYPLRDLTPDEHERLDRFHYVKFEPYPQTPDSIVVGQFWTQADLDNKDCQTVTTMGRELSETYARNPKFYGLTYCFHCRKHLPVDEFVWIADGQRVGS